MKNLKYYIMTCLLLTGCSSMMSEKYEPVETVNNVDLEKYSGKWYEIASIPQIFQEGCVCTTAEYTPMSDYVKVLNSCLKYSKDGKLSSAEGKAYVEPGSNNTKLKVSFFEPFKADYWIVDRDESYSYAVVSNPKRSTLWILSRTPRLKGGMYQEITDKLKVKGFPVEKLNRTSQYCGNR